VRAVRSLVPALAALAFAACGGGTEAAPTEWCVTTTRLMYVLDQHSTTAEQETLNDWRELAPDDVRGATEKAVSVLGRYPVDANNADLVAARREIEEYADGHCPEETRTFPATTTSS
jgi:hypothetical protein